MPISSFTPNVSRRYLPKSLPLTGDNYQLTVRHQNPGRQRQITKNGNQIHVRSGNPADNVTIQTGPRGMTFSRGAGMPTHLRQTPNQIAINRPNGQHLRINKSGNQIAVDRPGVSHDVIFTQTDTGLLIDRYGAHNDVRITSGPGQVSFEYGQPLKNTVVNLPQGLDFDPVTFQEETTLDPHGLAILNKWFSENALDGSDLVTLTQRGEVLEADNLLR